MNNYRRKCIEKVLEQFNSINVGALEALREDVTEIRDDEQEFYENMPENLQTGERGENAQMAADALDNAAIALEDVIERMSEIDAHLTEAAAV